MMALWTYINIRFTDNVPSVEQLQKINSTLKAIDYDFPGLEEYGMSSKWRAPQICLSDLMAYLHNQGFSCAGSGGIIYDEEYDYVTAPIVSKELILSDKFKEELKNLQA